MLADVFCLLLKARQFDHDRFGLKRHTLIVRFIPKKAAPEKVAFLFYFSKNSSF
jgi:hypothetical protein